MVPSATIWRLTSLQDLELALKQNLYPPTKGCCCLPPESLWQFVRCYWPTSLELSSWLHQQDGRIWILQNTTHILAPADPWPASGQGIHIPQYQLHPGMAKGSSELWGGPDSWWPCCSALTKVTKVSKYHWVLSRLDRSFTSSDPQWHKSKK